MVHFFEFYINHTVYVLELILQFNGQCQNFLYMYTRCLYIIQVSHYTHTSISDPFVDYQGDLININILSGVSFTMSFKINDN